MLVSEVIKGIVLSEKSLAAPEGSYTLKVNLKAKKSDVASALKAVFGVDVVSVNTSIKRGKVKRKMRAKNSGAVVVKAANQKKAYVTLKKGQTLPTPVLGEAANV
jgi:large subunit ribosomal protein L23